MSFFHALYTSTSGMMAQSQSTAMISSNIANVNSAGYKRSEASFADMVATTQSSLGYNPGYISTTQVQRITEAGALQQTPSTSESAISGRGFFAVHTSPNATSDGELSYTRNGTFNLYAVSDGTSSDTSYLRNSAGHFLYGWAIGDGGAAGAGALVPVSIDFNSSTFRATSSITQSLTLDADENMIDMLAAAGGASTLPASQQSYYGVTDTSEPAHFSRSIEVIDTLGNTRNLTFEYRRVVGPMAHFSSGTQNLEWDDEFGDGATAGINVGDEFTIETTAPDTTGTGTPTTTTETYTIVAPGTADIDANQVSTIGELVQAIRAHGTGDELEARLTDDGQIVVQAADPTAEIALAETIGTPLSGLSSLDINQAPGGGYAYVPDADITAETSTTYPNQADFPDFVNVTDPNTQGWWEVRVLREADPGITDPLDPLYQQPIEITKGLINFNTDGLLNAARDSNGQVTDGIIDLANIDFDSSITGEELALTVDINRYAHYASSYNVITFDHDGVETGYPVSVEIDSDGTVISHLSNGDQQALYRVPVVTFTNADGLQSINGTAFRTTSDSGEPTYNTAGTNGAGSIKSSFVENANVDLADEFANLIVSQRAFSANSKVITTVDEMTKYLAQLKR